MSNSWAIIIGINQYQGFQPLMQAQNDAVGIRRYLIEEAGFAPENCILLSDLSKSTEQEAVFPDQVAINDWLETICQGRVQQDDTLWFYFSGYGAQADNKDYLMPVDGDPAQVKQTGIALQEVVKYLKQAPTKDIIMVLDMNRSQSALAGQAIGEHVAKLASKARIPLILSCQPNEFSHETLAVRHGLFTAALLEGLRYDGCATLSHLERYLIERIPELCEHHWRPIQNPVVMLPEEQKFQLLWHQRDGVTPGAEVAAAAAAGLGGIGAAALADTPESDMAMVEDAPDTAFLIPDNPDAEFIADDADLIPDDPDAEFTVNDPDADLIPDNPDAFGDENDLVLTPDLVLAENLSETPDQESFAVDMDEDEDNSYGTTTVDDLPDNQPVKGNWGGCIGLLAAFAALGLLLAVLFRNQALVQSTLQNRVPPDWLARIGLGSDGSTDETTPDDATPSGDTPDDPDAVADIADEEPTAAVPDDPDATPDDPDAATPDDPDAVPDDPDAAATPDDPDADTPDAVAEEETDAVEETDDTDAAVDAPDAAVGDASDTPPEGVAASGNTTNSSTSTPDASAADAPGDGANTAALLEEARRSLRPSQASRFASAIATAKKVPTDDPNYPQAQADIQRWSQVIMDLAEGRAAENDFQGAINAAKLIPNQPADIHGRAQELISTWQTRADARALIREAQTIPRTGQASTYQRGILKLQEVPEDLPIDYADAQRLIGEWTGKMLAIAQSRADRGLYFGAIEAAELIPEGTPNYDQAQAEIRRWKGE